MRAFARSEERRRALAAGFNMRAAKPIETAELLTIASRLAARAR